MISRYEATARPRRPRCTETACVAPGRPAAPVAAARPPKRRADAAPAAVRERDTGPKREPRARLRRHASSRRRRIGLDGRFQELNPAFSDLVGYTESEFQQAVWPPVMDRANLEKHREQMKDMLAGKIESAEIKTGYVHAQGLLVPVVGTLTLVRENGEPRHFLLETSR